jgi:hypothetical protein
VEAARAVRYVNAGTVEGLLDADGTYYFLEMNTRLQVEHTITEMVTGLDLVREQLRIASGEPLSIAQSDVTLRGHSIQCRINAEDPARDFVPTPGRVTRYREPSGPGVRVDSGVVEGSSISELYDPMIAKLIVWDADRELARRRMLRALSEFQVEGVHSLIPIHRAILEHPEFAAGGTMHDFVEGGGYARSLKQEPSADGAAATPEPTRNEARTLVTEVDGERFEVTVLAPEHPGRRRLRRRRAQLAQLWGHRRRRRLLHDLLVAPLDRAVTFAEMHDRPVAVGQHLHLDVPRPLQVALEKHAVVGEVRLALPPRGLVSAPQELRIGSDLDALTAAAGRRLDRHRIADPLRDLERLLDSVHRGVGAGDDGHAGPLHQLTRAGLRSHRLDRIGRRPHEHQPGRRAGAGERSVLGQESEPGVHRLRAAPQGGAHDRL